jgi:hypothetical protein
MDERPSVDEAIGQYLLNQPLVRSAREQPDRAMPWIVLGLAVVIAALIGGAWVLLVLLVGLPTILGARLLSRRRRRD